MLFSEIYGCYFDAVAAVLAEAAGGCLTRERMTALVREKAFAESVLSIPAALERGDWPLLDRELRPALRHRPSMPLTHLERRWLKALLLDPRIALFDPDPAGLEDVEPLYTPDMFVLFDQYADGDPYGDEDYVRRFRVILAAVREKRMLRLELRDRRGISRAVTCAPCRLEYSKKDDKFRLLAASGRSAVTVNLARVTSCRMLAAQAGGCLPERPRRELTLLLRDERNALERALLHFSHLEKETRHLDGPLYELKLRYDRDDETELLIRVLSFGPAVKAVSPPSFVALVRERVARQRRLAPPEGKI